MFFIKKKIEKIINSHLQFELLPFILKFKPKFSNFYQL